MWKALSSSALQLIGKDRDETVDSQRWMMDNESEREQWTDGIDFMSLPQYYGLHRVHLQDSSEGAGSPQPRGDGRSHGGGGAHKAAGSGEDQCHGFSPTPGGCCGWSWGRVGCAGIKSSYQE